MTRATATTTISFTACTRCVARVEENTAADGVELNEDQLKRLDNLTPADEALGQDFRTRGARQEEQIDLLRRLFTEPVVDFTGRFDRVDRAALVPKPTRSIPIWLGGSGHAAFERAARLADGFGAEYVAVPGGGPDLPAQVDAWRAAGGTHVSVATMGLGLDSVEAHIDYLATVAAALSLK